MIRGLQMETTSRLTQMLAVFLVALYLRITLAMIGKTSFLSRMEK